MGVFSGMLRLLSTIDMDEVLAYHTTKEVKMLDRRLGLLCWMIRLIIAAYIVAYVFIGKEGYTQQEVSAGHVVAEVEGTAFSMSNGIARAWDVTDVVRPAVEDGALLLATHVLHTPAQRIGNCTSPRKKCSRDSDCAATPPLSSGHCAGGMCLEMQWCPAEHEALPDVTATHVLKGVERFSIWFKASVHFPSLDASRVFSTMDEQHPRPYLEPGSKRHREAELAAADAAAKADASAAAARRQAGGDGERGAALGAGEGGAGGVGPGVGGLPPNQFELGELLRLAGSSFESVARTGAVLSVSLLWSCFVDDPVPCAPRVQVERLDHSAVRSGYVHEHADYFRPAAAGGVERDLHTVRGVRLLLSSRGVGKKVSLAAIMLHISSFIALLWLANYAADFLMLSVLPERRHYRTYKQERTPDFSDLRAKIAQVEGEKQKLRERKNRFAAKLDVS